ncbi:MAG: EamA family transporter [Rhizobiaceae bacterium]|nr:EamA family transporter [Rhizobiaceae bacterium]
MSAFALTLVLSAAVLHASWNAVVKAATDRALTIAAIATMHALAGIVLIALSGPPAPASWPSIAISTLLHYFYYVLMFQAYRLGDLSQVYPISRGMAPALVALGTFLLIGESLSPLALAGLAAISAGIGVLALQRGAAHADRRALVAAGLLGLTIAAYSVADGIGVRWSNDPTGYMGWLFLLESPVVIAVLARRKRNGIKFDARTYCIGLVGGIVSVTAYGVVLYAKTIAPIGAVSAVRESSVIIAALIGVVLFGERPWRGRIVSAIIVAAGVVLLAFSGSH